MKLRRILLNLSGNAIKFTKAGRVELGARVIDIKDNTATIEFSVKDTGIGISIENQTKVFERFFKVSPSYKRHYEGHGLGLHIAQSFVHLLGGDIHLTSELDVGTTISFVLSMKIAEKPLIDDVSSKLAETALKPVTSHVIETKQIAPAEQCSLATTHTKRVLLVDDDSTMLFSLNGFMTPYDVTVSQAEDAELAFELVTSKAFDLIISDVGLPLMQGDELARKIRPLRQTMDERQRLSLDAQDMVLALLHKRVLMRA